VLDVYWGELLISPNPLELSLNSCSHMCSYCFANLNKGKHTENPASAMRLLADYGNRSTLTAQLLQGGYPVVVSNRMDPFSRTNYEQIIPMLRVMVEMGIPIEIQTKGGTGIDDVLSFLPPSLWYISLSMIDDGIRKKIEPGATSVHDRLDLVQKLTDAGHTVVWGLNPYVPEWLPEPERLFEAMAERGCQGVWLETLHLNYRQCNAMTNRQKDALTEPIMKRARKRKIEPDLWDAIMWAYVLADVYETPYFSKGLPYPTDFVDVMRKPYDKSFPTLQDWVNWCYANKQDGDAVTCDEFVSVVTQGIPQRQLKLHHYLGATAHDLWWTHKIPLDMTYSDLYRIMWAEPRTSQCPGNMRCFAYQGTKEQPRLDAKGLPLMVFDSRWFETQYA